MPKLATISTHTDPLDAHILRCRLEAEDIPAFIAGEHHIGMNWLMSNALGGVRVQVPEPFSSQALTVISDIKAGAYQIEDEQTEALSCPKCGSQHCTPLKTSWRIAFLALFFLSMPLPFRKLSSKCLACGHVQHHPRD